MGNRTINNIITITRAGWGTYYNSSGILVSAGAGVARLDYNPSTLQPRGYLVESARTNLLLQSEALNTTWGNYGPVSVVSNVTTAPNGYMLADKMVEANTAPPGSPFYVVNQTVSGLSSNTYVFSVFLKAGERYQSGLRIDDATSSNVANVGINLSDGTTDAITAFGTAINPIVKVEPINNGWYRCSIATQFTQTTISSVRVMLRVRNNSGNYDYTGDGISGLYAWGAQLEVGKYPTSYIPTSTSTVSRIGDQTEVANVGTWFNKTEGTFVIDAERYVPGTSIHNIQDGLLIGVSDNHPTDAALNFSNSMYVYNQTLGANQIAVVMMSNNAGQLISTLLPTANSVTSPFKFGLAYKSNDVVISTPVNMHRYPNNFENADWIKGNVSVSAVTSATTSPDGLYNAKKITETFTRFHVLNQAVTVYQGYTTTMSYYLKSAERTEVIFGFDPTSAGSFQYGKFNLSTGVATAFLGSPTVSMTSVGNGWYLCNVTAVMASTVFNNSSVGSLQLIGPTGTNDYTADNVSGIYIWGAKLTFTAPDGSVVIQDNTVNLPPAANLNMVRIGCAPWTPSQNFWDGWIRSVTHYPVRVANTTLTSLSS